MEGNNNSNRISSSENDTDTNNGHRRSDKEQHRKRSKKSLKINVMRDLKSAQKLKNAFTNTKNSNIFNNNETFPLNYNQTEEFNLQDHQALQHQHQNLDIINKFLSSTASRADCSILKRSQTFSTSSSLPRNFSKTRPSILPNQRDSIDFYNSNINNLNDPNDLNNMSENFLNTQSPTDSHSSFYTDNRRYNNCPPQGSLYKSISYKPK